MTQGHVLQRLEQGLAALAGAILFAMTLLTVADVAGRYLFNSPVPGAYQAIAGGMGVLVFTGIPLVTARDAHLTVGLGGYFLVGRHRQRCQAIVSVLCSGVMAGLTWRLWEQARYLGATGLLLDVLLVPVAGFVYYMAFMAALSTGLLVAIAIDRLRAGPPVSPPC